MLLAAGAQKILAPLPTLMELHTLAGSLPGEALPVELVFRVALLLEVGLGTWLVLDGGVRPAIAACGALALFTAFLLWKALEFGFGTPCGCSVVIEMSVGWGIGRNALLAALLFPGALCVGIRGASRWCTPSGS